MIVDRYGMARRKQRSKNLRIQQVSTRAGSNAGRGFRYQDAAGAWLALKCWANELPYGTLVPEGRDDIEMAGADGTAFVQVKSRRDKLGLFSAGEAAAYVRELWDRAEAAADEPAELILMLERGVGGLVDSPGTFAPIDLADVLGLLLAKDFRKSKWLARTRLVVAPAPMEGSIGLLTRKLGCRPLTASVYYAALTDQVGQISDENGTKAVGSFLALSLSDVERTIDALAGSLSVENLEAPVRLGLCEPVDFLTPQHDPSFYAGVDVQPGHIAAGLLFERPEARGRVLETLGKRRAALIAGPSGSGKSGLMWEAAHASRHTVRWFRVQQATEADVPQMLRLADSFRATAHAPIGFVVDDVGRNRSTLWDTLATEAAARPNVVLLGSLREEDMFLLGRRSASAELREQPDEALAERVWRELRQRGQTNWPGWREPWAISRSLLLEYVHLLTQGRRLEEVLGEQVDRRYREHRDLELGVLRLSAAAGRAGASVEVGRLRAVLSAGDDDLARALKRLIDEHLVRKIDAARLGSLHQIRAASLYDIIHQTAPPSRDETAARTLACVPDSELEGFVARTLAAEPELADTLVRASAARVIQAPDLGLLAGLLRGLDTGRIANTVIAWLPQLRGLGVPSTQATMAAMFAVANTQDVGIDRLRLIFQAAQLFREARYDDLRPTLLTRLIEQTPILVNTDQNWGSIVGLLTELSGTEVPEALERALAALAPDLLGLPLPEAVTLLETAFHAAPAVAEAWVERVGVEPLLGRVTSATPWASQASLRNEPDGTAVCADIFHISDRLQRDLHESVVQVCRRLFAVAPMADLAISRAVAADREPAGIGHYALAQKRMPRSALPPEAWPARNRRWIAAVAQCVAPESLSHYLAEGIRLLHRLTPALEKVVDGAARGKVKEQYLGVLGEIHEASLELTRPPSEETLAGLHAGVGVADLQNVLFHCSADLVRALARLPEGGAASFYVATEILKQIDRAISEEPWVLIGDGPPPVLTQLRDLVSALRLVFGEAAQRNVKASQLAGGLARNARPGNAARLLYAHISQQIDARLKELSEGLAQVLSAHGFVGQVFARVTDETLGPWPYAEALVVISLSTIETWPVAVQVLSVPLRTAAGDGRNLILVPAVDGWAAPSLAMSGFSTFLPTGVKDMDWLRQCGVRVLATFRADAYDRMSNGLLEASAIEVFGCATQDRAVEERDALERALADIECGLATVRASASAELGEEISTFIDQVRRDSPNLAGSFWAQMHGGPPSEEVRMLSILKLAVLQEDIEAARMSSA